MESPINSTLKVGYPGKENDQFNVDESDVDWLIQTVDQAKARADKNKQDLEDMDRQLFKEQKENQRLRKALEDIVSKRKDYFGESELIIIAEAALEGDAT
ncbi:tRNA(Phe) wybutosine-synthesizing methylase Tyw3 [Pullulanibacillus pueri]|uniref:Uncharacterized protein n=1 Tax=Pullulanibacillus pueri TaxID=1437324 RepID=A0A8J3EMK1_9BACL|nr:hypothetical protein [Pullulanibacillus pueri]MBM7681967.1 tRNA(Phe) wybutosine-synthesizing methylase Tyw3 [Pullulanibacillus pueri]GGH83617.1 hypothetical protein GCM10007096_24780 [Pullulanibacillus pueri]